MLVVANLINAPLLRVSLTSSGTVLDSGRYSGTVLIGDISPATLRVGMDGQIRGYVPLAVLRPMESYVVELVPRTNGR